MAINVLLQKVVTQPIVLMADCIALRDMLSKEKLPSAHARWREQLLAHNIVLVKHGQGRRHLLAHGLSRRPSDQQNGQPQRLQDNTQPLIGAIEVDPGANQPAQRYLQLDATVDPLLCRFEGDKFEPLLGFLLLLETLLLETPQTAAKRDKIRRQGDYYVEKGQLLYTHDNQALGALPGKQARAYAHQVHGRGHARVTILVNILRLQQGVNWPCMWRDVRQVVKKCQTCQQFGTRRTSAIDPMVVSSPMQVWAMDEARSWPSSTISAVASGHLLAHSIGLEMSSKFGKSSVIPWLPYLHESLRTALGTWIVLKSPNC